MRTRRLALLAAIAGALLWLGCDHVGSGDVPDSGDDTSTETDDPYCESQGADDFGGGCAPGFYCNEDHVCDQDCTIDDQCVEAHGDGWVCNAFGMCIVDDLGSDA
jgi:hypothetical protein